MKKIILMMAAGAAMLTMAACGDNCGKGGRCGDADKDVAYTGVIPAADCDGIRYTLLLDYDDDGRDGDYRLVETYLQADSVSPLGYKDLRSFSSEGDFTVGRKADKTFIKLVEDHAAPGAQPVYFVVDSDNQITMANAELEVSEAPGLNYTLTRAN